MLILPGHPLFQITLETAWNFLNTIVPNQYYVKGVDGFMRPATPDELTEYLEGGEFDEVEETAEELDYVWMG